MEKRGELEIRVQGRSGSLELSPDRYDIRYIVKILKYAEQLLFPVDKNNRPLITYRISEGSVVHTLETSYPAILSIDAVLHKIARDNYAIDFLETAAARSLEFFLQLAQKHQYAIELATSVSPGSIIQINSSSKFIVSLHSLRNFTFQDIPIQVQQTIVRQFDALRTETQKLEAVYQKKLADLEELKKSIFQKTFAGELKTEKMIV